MIGGATYPHLVDLNLPLPLTLAWRSIIADLSGRSIQPAALHDRILLAAKREDTAFRQMRFFRILLALAASATCYRHRLETASWPH
jgi:hypothetical protein